MELPSFNTVSALDSLVEISGDGQGAFSPPTIQYEKVQPTQNNNTVGFLKNRDGLPLSPETDRREWPS